MNMETAEVGGCGGGGGGGGGGGLMWGGGAETLYHRDYALLYIAYVLLVWARFIPGTRS